MPDTQHQPLIGHERPLQWFRNAIRGGRLASTFLLVGPPGIGKRTFALHIAQSVLCETRPAELLDPCGQCSSCRQVLAGTHPDILTVARPEDRANIPVELLIGPREARMQEGLCHDIRLRPMSGDRRIAIIDDCDALNTEGANSLLKTLEEPPPRALIFLIGTSLQRQLPTIRSRCQVVRFDLPTGEDAERILRLRAEAEGIGEESLAEAIRASDGDFLRACLLMDEDTRRLREELYGVLAGDPPQAQMFERAVTAYVTAAGADAPPRRARMRKASDLAAEFYRQRLRIAAVEGTTASSAVEEDLFRLERSLEVRLQVDRNANQSTLIEAWADDLQRGKPLTD